MRLSFLMFASLLSVQIAKAEIISTNKDWNLEDRGTHCVAWTQRNVEAQNYVLEMSLERSGKFPVEILMRLQPEPAQVQAVFTYDAKKNIHYHFLKTTSEQGGFLYQLPRGTENLISYIKRGTSFNVSLQSPGFPAQALAFSLRGSSATVDALIAKCNGGKALVSAAFEKAFLDQELLGKFDPTLLTEDKVKLARETYMKAAVADTELRLKEKELATLTANYAKKLADLEKLGGRIGDLEAKKLVQLNQEKATLEAQILKLENDIKAKESEILVKDKELLVANQNYDQAWQALAPHEPEHKKLSDLLSSARRSLSSEQGRLSQINDEIASNEREIRSLESEASQLQSRLSSLGMDQDRARREYNNASRENSMFNEDQERRERLRRSSGYENAKRELERSERELDNARRQEQRAERELNQAENRLNGCRNKPDDNCASEKNEVQRARAEAQQARQEVNRAESGIRQSRNEIERAERQVEAEVRSEKSQLMDRELRARRNLENIDSEVATLERRVRDINNFDIPTRQNRLSSLRSERPGVESNIRNLKSEVASRDAALVKFKQSVGYDAKKAEVDRTANIVRDLKKQIATLEANKTVVETKLIQTRKSLDLNLKNLEKLMAEIQKSKTEYAELQKLLIPYFEGKAILDSEIGQRRQTLEVYRQTFHNQLV